MRIASLPRAVTSLLDVQRVAAAIGLSLLVAGDAASGQRAAGVPSVRDPSRPRAARLECDTTWSNLRELRTPTRQRVYVEAPVRVTNTVGTFLIGSPTYVWADTAAFVDESSVRHAGDVGVRLLNDTTAVPLPPLPTATTPYMPIAVARGSKLLAVWGTSSDTSRSGIWHQDTLWEATLSDGRWSAARPILASGEFVWHPGAGSWISDDSSVILAFPSTDTTRIARRGVTIMIRSRDRWRSRRIDIGSFGLFGAAVVRTAPSEVLVAGVGSIEHEGTEILNGVYAIRVSTRDTVSTPRIDVIRQITNGHAEDPAVFLTPQSEHVVWRQPGRQSFTDDSLVEATSLDHGERWTVTSALSIAGDTRGMSVVSLGNGDAIAIAHELRRGEMRMLRRTRGHWTLDPQSFPDAKTIPMISAPSDRISVSFGQTRPSTAPDGLLHDAPVLVTASRSHRCELPTAMPSQERLRAPPRGKTHP
jgi:hypothetical protein